MKKIKIIFNFVILAISAILYNLFSEQYKQLLIKLNINLFWGILVPVLIIIVISNFNLIISFLKKILLKNEQLFQLNLIKNTLESSYQYNGNPLFYVDIEVQDQFAVFRKNIFRNKYLLRRLLFKYPVVYYNVTAKCFLNWIDFLYLNVLKRLRDQAHCKIIISLHCDEELSTIGLMREKAAEDYRKKLTEAQKIIEMILGKDVTIYDEISFIYSSQRQTKDFSEQFFNTFLSSLNFYIKQLDEKLITWGKFFRYESNLLSLFPIIELAKKFGHLFVLDYKGSFDIWNRTPYNSMKDYHNIFFLKCNKIEDVNGERIPSWTENDGVNFTDSHELVLEKLKHEKKEILDSMYSILIDSQIPNEMDLIVTRLLSVISKSN